MTAQVLKLPTSADERQRVATRVPRADDEGCVALLRAGDARGPAVFYDRFAPYVRKVVVSVVGARPEVEDVVQETFFRAFRRLDTLKDPSRTRAWVARIALNEARMWWRTQKRRRLDRGDAWDDDVYWELAGTPRPAHGDVGEGVDQRRFYGHLYALLGQVSFDDRAAFVLRYVEGCALEEVAEVLRVSLATAKRRIARVEQFLRRRAQSDEVLAAFRQQGREVLT